MTSLRFPKLKEETIGETEWSIVLRRFKKNKLAVAGLIIVGIVLLIAIFAPLIAPYSPVNQNLSERISSPSKTHLLGTDEYGRDVLSRIIYGSRIALMLGVVVVAIEVIIGVTLGLISGYFGGKIDQIIMRTVDVVWAFPALILALAIVVILGPGIFNVMIAIGIVGWARYARVVRGEVLSVKEEAIVEAARAIGEKDSRIIISYIFPNVVPSILVLATLDIPGIIITGASLSFLGLGAQPPTACWGAMLAEGRAYLELAPWLATFPGLAIMFTVLGFNFVGDGLRDASQPEVFK